MTVTIVDVARPVTGSGDVHPDLHAGPCPVTGGVDTHLDLNVAAALDGIGGLLGVAEFPATLEGHRQMLGWLSGFGPVARVGVEGTGSYGAGLARFLRRAGVAIVEVDRPNRQARRQDQGCQGRGRWWQASRAMYRLRIRITSGLERPSASRRSM